MPFTKEQFEALNKDSGNAVISLRKAAFDRIKDAGLIPSKSEEWRFTPSGNFSLEDYSVIGPDNIELKPESLPKSKFPGVKTIRVRSGRLDKESLNLSDLPEGVTLRSFRESLESDPKLMDKLSARPALPGQEGLRDLLLAGFTDGIYLKIEKNIVVETPLHFLFENSGSDKPSLISTVLFIETGENSKVEIIEEYSSSTNSKRWINGDTTILIGENGSVNHLVLNDETDESVQSSRLSVSVSDNGSYSGHNFNFGGKTVRQDSHIGLDGDGSSSVYNTLSLLDGNRHFGQYTWQSHAAPHTQSSQTIKMILKDTSTGVFNGRVMVKPEGQKTDAHQTNRNLIMSPKALVHSNPQLEIDADDVKCSHGSTTGELDDDAIFYLQSRGIDRDSALNLLVEGFARELVDSIPIDAASAKILEKLNTWLHNKGE